MAEACAAWIFFSRAVNTLFMSGVSWALFAWINMLHILRCRNHSWNALDVPHSSSTASHSMQPFAPATEPVWSASCPPAPPHSLKHPWCCSPPSLPVHFSVSPNPETLQHTVCSCLKAGFHLLSSDRDTDTLISAKNKGLTHLLCMV